MRLPLTLALACRRRGERDCRRLVAVELHGQLRQRDVPARSGYGRFARARAIVAVRYCGALQTRANIRATAPATCRSTALRATTSTAAPWGLSSAGRCPTRLAAWRAGRRSRACAPARRPAAAAATPLSAGPCTSPPTHAARRVIAGYPGLVGSVPPAISALSALTFLCVPFARPGSPPTRRLLCCASAAAARGRSIFGAAAPFFVRDQGLGHEPLLRQRAADDLRADRAHAPVRLDSGRARRRCGCLRHCLQRSGCAWAVHLRRGRTPPLCVIRRLDKNGFTGPILASITALTRLVELYAVPPPVRSSGRLAQAERERCGAGTSARTASPAAHRRRSPR
jgi:hypothetical protein